MILSAAPIMAQDLDTLFYFDPSDTNIDWDRSLLNQEINKSTRVIGLGEFTHGAREVFEIKNDIIKYLIENKGVEMVLFEFPDIMFRYINYYLLEDKAYSDEAARSLILLNLNSSYRTEEIVKLCMMIKKHNLSNKVKVQLRGIDISPTIFPPIDYIITTYVTPADKDAANSLLSLKGKIPDTALLHQVGAWMLNDKSQPHPKITENNFLNFDYDIKAAKASYLMQNVKWSPLMRDSCMSENVKLLSDGHLSVVWAHNNHLMKSISTREENRNLGSYLNSYYRTAYYMIATDFFGSAEVMVRKQEPGTNKSVYLPNTFSSKKQSFVNNYAKDKKFTKSFLLFKKDFKKTTSDINLNCIDVVGTYYLLSQKRKEGLPFDALIVLKGVSPARMIK
ncbi:erythromycin esterase family protein [Pedobacter foliorum]|uniref:erythromycin esterase family protein n=1 Tax=Pedobacter foliorum TaxID=2739058 RepID=UPI001565DFAF|nr:erythromycin esterase family protein [Pedobacter foliorum]NRF40234.1 erythromycin esterase family protein [Pedobacter foliorum]